MRPARADLESLLRDRKLDRTLTTALPDRAALDEYATAPCGITRLDARLGGGFPRGEVSEVIGARSTGRTSVVLHALAAATGRGEIAAIVDALDRFDVASADAAGINLRRLLWIRGEVVANPVRGANDRALDRAIKAITLVLQAGNFGLVVFDAADAPVGTLQRLPFTTWRRLHRIIEGSQTACLVVSDAPLARSARGVTVRAARSGEERHGLLLEGLAIQLDVIRARNGVREDVCLSLSTVCR